MTSATVQITDSHCHLDFPDFDAERDAVIARAIEAGVTRMVAICTKLSGLAKVQAISEAHAEVFHTFGVHPMSAHEHPPVTAEQLVSLSAHPKFVGIGETGLDYHYTAESAEIQKASLRVHCAAMGHPIVGDGKYGGQEAFLTGSISRKMHLHARRLIISQPGGGQLDVTAELPEHFATTMEQMGFDLSLSDAEPLREEAPPKTRAEKKQDAKQHAKQYRKARRGERRSRNLSKPAAKAKARAKGKPKGKGGGKR